MTWGQCVNNQKSVNLIKMFSNYVWMQLELIDCQSFQMVNCSRFLEWGTEAVYVMQIACSFSLWGQSYMFIKPNLLLQCLILSTTNWLSLFNPLTSVAISKLLEMIGSSAYFPCVLNHDHSPLGHKPDCRLGWSSEYVRKSMHSCHSVCCVQASQAKPATRQNRVNSKVNSRGTNMSQRTTKGYT